MPVPKRLAFVQYRAATKKEWESIDSWADTSLLKAEVVYVDEETGEEYVKYIDYDG